MIISIAVEVVNILKWKKRTAHNASWRLLWQRKLDTELEEIQALGSERLDSETLTIYFLTLI